MKSNITNEFKCRICNGKTRSIQIETRNEKNYTVVQCLDCKTIQTVEHIDEVSPDYINLTQELLSHVHIEQSRKHKKAAFNQFVKVFKDLITNNASIVDIGCGTGGFGEYVTKLGYLYFGFDASGAQIDFGKQRGLNVTQATTCDEYISKGIIRKDKTDVITMWDVLEHIRKPHEFLSGVRNLMHPQTYLFISVPNGGAFAWKRMFNTKVSFDPWEHVFYYNINSIEILLNDCGFDLIKSGSVVCYPRKLNFKEIFRRLLFKVLSKSPSISPQIFVIAKIKMNE